MSSYANFRIGRKKKLFIVFLLSAFLSIESSIIYLSCIIYVLNNVQRNIFYLIIRESVFVKPFIILSLFAKTWDDRKKENIYTINTSNLINDSADDER